MPHKLPKNLTLRKIRKYLEDPKVGWRQHLMTPVVKRKAIADSKALCPCPILPDLLTPSRHAGTHTHAPRDIVPPAQLKKREKHPWRSVNPSKHAGFHPTTLLTATLLHGCFFSPLNLYKWYPIAQRIAIFCLGF